MNKTRARALLLLGGAALLLPLLAHAAGRITLTVPPVTVTAGSSTTLSAITTTTLDCSSSSTVITITWDTDGDGAYDDATGTSYLFDASSLSGPGTATVSARAANTGTSACTDDDTVIATISIANAPPSITSLSAPSTVNEGATASFTGAATDAEASDVLTYSWDFGDSTTATGASASHIYAEPGTYTVTLEVSDGADTDSQTATVSVTNLSPSASITATSATSTEGSSSSYTCSGTDPGGGTVSYSWDFGDGSTATGATASHTWTDNGSYSVECAVSDGDGGAQSATTTTTVSNADPTISASTLPSSGDEGVMVSFSVTASDVGADDTLSYFWTFGDGGTSTLQSPTRTYSDNGGFSVQVFVFDDDGGSAFASRTINISNVDPVASASGPSTGPEGSALSYTCSAADVSGDTISYAWSFSDGTSGSGSSVSKIWTDDASRSATCTATDGDGGTDSDTVSTTVTNANPVISASTIPTSGSEGTSLTFSVTAADPGADTLSYAWSFGDGSTATTASAAKAYADNGTYTVNLSITDGEGGSATASGTVTVSNLAPTATASGPSTSDEGVAQTYSCTATDPSSADTLTFTWSFSDGATASGATATHTWTTSGTGTATCKATDDDGSFDTDTVTTTVNASAPSFSSATLPTTGTEGLSVSFSATARGADSAEVFSYAWDFGDGSASTLQSPSHVYADDGTYAVEVVATDSDGLTVSRSANIVISNADPTATITGPSTGDEGDLLSWTCSASDPGSADTLTYAWDFGDGTSGAGSSASHSYADNGSYTVSCTATDDDGGDGVVVRAVSVANLSPNLSGTPDTLATDGLPYSFTPTVTDPGTADTFTWRLTTIPATTALVDGAGVVTWSPDYSDEGTHTFALEVRDDDGGGDALTWTVEVSAIDTDGDGLADGAEAVYGTDHLDPDTDRDGLSDYEEVIIRGTNPLSDDTDGDSLSDRDEVSAGMDPLDADMDDDGLGDYDELLYGTVYNICDSDGDGLSDGLEAGASTPGSDTDTTAGCWTADLDSSSTTNPDRADSDGDGLDDGEEDQSGDGIVDSDETDPNDADSDDDLLSDFEEPSYGTDARDGDTDDDGRLDGHEVVGVGTDPALCDTDGDGLSDGLEDGIVSFGLYSDTDLTSPCFALDTDTSTTDGLDADSDDDGLQDGEEDVNMDGGVGAGEVDPNMADSDGDGVPDGEETDWDLDTDGDGVINALDSDADDDGLTDTLEVDAGDRIPSGWDADGLLTAPRDTDGDTLMDMVDDNDDDDSRPTREESPSLDTDSDGLVDYLDPDDDDDGFILDDCDPLDSAIFPGSAEVAVDGLDQDCDGGDTCYTDADSDGFYVETELPSVDMLCGNDLGEAATGDVDGDGDVDEGQDRDGDGVADYGYTPDGLEVDLPADCDDSTADIQPFGGDDCEPYGDEQIDNDCDGNPNTVTSWDDLGNADITNDVLTTTTVEGNEYPFYPDRDGDGFGEEGAEPLYPCEPPDSPIGGVSYVPSAGDCDDENEFVYPGADEVCNGLDEDCDGINDEPEDLGETSGCAQAYADHDLDGYGSDEPEDMLCLCYDGVLDPDIPNDCPAGSYEVTDDGTCYTNKAGDCYDYDANIYEGAVERLDGDDNNCDTKVAAVELDCDDDGSLPLSAVDLGLEEDEELNLSTLGLATACTEGVEIELLCWGAPARLTCNSDGLWSATRTDEGVADHFNGGARSYSAGRLTFAPGDCDDQCAARYPGAAEICDGRDNNCDLGSVVVDSDADGLIDQVETDAERVGRISPEELDLDGDGYVSCSTVPTEEESVLTSASCDSTFVDNGLFGDCNDECALSTPVAEEERCNGFLDICDGLAEGTDLDQDGHATCGLTSTDDGSALVEDVFVLVWYGEAAERGSDRPGPGGLSLGARDISEARDTGLEDPRLILPLLLPRPEAEVCDSPLELELSERIGAEPLQAAVEHMVAGELAEAAAPLLQLCIDAEKDAESEWTGRCGVVRLSLSATADEQLLLPDDLAALGQQDCHDHPEQRTWRTVWSRERVLQSRRLVQEWECYRSSGTYGCGDLEEPEGWVDGSAPTPGGTFSHTVPAELLSEPTWWTEIGRFSPSAVSVGILYGCWDAVEIDARAGQTVGGDCSDGRNTAHREEPEGPGDLVALYDVELAELASCDRCLDGIDNNCDGTLDCEDPTCAVCFVGQGSGCADADSPCAAGGCTSSPSGALWPTGFGLGGLTLAAVGLRRRRR